MKEMDYLVRGDVSFEDTYNLRKIIGTNVLSKNGLFVGKVLEVRIMPEKTAIEGIVVYRGLFKKAVYIGKSFFSEITSEAVILNADPTFLLKGVKVLSSEGELLGKARNIIRKDNSNEIDKLILSSPWRKRTIIPGSAIKKIGESIFLAQGYNVDKKYFWQKS